MLAEFLPYLGATGAVFQIVEMIVRMRLWFVHVTHDLSNTTGAHPYNCCGLGVGPEPTVMALGRQRARTKSRR